MKKIFTSFLLLHCIISHAQWSNTTNQFYDSLHMPVCTAVGDQKPSIAVNSYPDGGYFIVWEDKRVGFYDPIKIYAQKFDAAGNQLWAQNGVEVGTSPNQQRLAYTGTTADYRDYSYAASDSSGGLYLTYTDDSISNYSWIRIMVQHFRPDGSKVFPGAGFIMASTAAGQGYNFSSPQLIADDNKGFYISYLLNTTDNTLHVYNYKDVGGVMTFYGGGVVNENYLQTKAPVGCGAFEKYSIIHPGTNISNYHIWPDLQGGCSVLMSMNGNTGSQGKMLCYNRVWRVKKNAAVLVQNQFPDFNPNPTIVNYQAGNVDILYKFKRNFLTRTCSAAGVVYVWTDDVLLTNGYRVLDQGGYDYNFVKGTTAKTSGNINVEVMASTKRTISGNVVSPFYVEALAGVIEKYDSVPYQVTGNIVNGYNLIQPPYPTQLDTLEFFGDTILATGTYYFDFSLAGGGNQVYAAALINEPGQDFRERNVRLQHLAVELQSPKRWRVQYKTNEIKGVKIGSEIYTGFSSNSISYEHAGVAVNNTGNAVFYTREYGVANRVSPIQNGAELSWGAMGRPIGTPVVNGNFVYPESPHIALHPTNGTGVISWNDTRNTPPNTGANIFMRHLDNLNVANYYPPINLLQTLANGGTFANPSALFGSSKNYSVVEAYNGLTGATSPVVEILDNYNLGRLDVRAYQHTGPIRTYNGKPYLNRNFTITPQNNPAGAANINLRLYFTTADFTALQTADPTILNPGYLAVVKQPNLTAVLPATYSPVAGEELLTPIAWAAVAGGYYVEIVVNSFSNFFLQKTTGVPLPVNFLNVQAKWLNATQATVSWQVAAQQQVKDYTVQSSIDGVVFSDVCKVNATTQTSYECVVKPAGAKNYYRVVETGVNGGRTISRTVLLQNAQLGKPVIYPNPVNDILYIDGLPNIKWIEVIDITGKVVMKQSGAGQGSIRVSMLSRGQYAVRVFDGKETQTLSFIKN